MKVSDTTRSTGRRDTLHSPKISPPKNDSTSDTTASHSVRARPPSGPLG